MQVLFTFYPCVILLLVFTSSLTLLADFKYQTKSGVGKFDMKLIYEFNKLNII